MFKLTQNTPTGGDCTCGFSVSLDKDYTVGEFINTVLKERSNEWGFFSIRSTSVNCSCSYRRGAIEGKCFTEDILSKPIMHVNACGGYSAMDYQMKID